MLTIGMLLGNTNAAGPADMSRDKRQQCDMPRPLYGYSQGTLVPGTSAGTPPGLNLAPVRYETAQLGNIFVIDYFDLIAAELADLALGCIFSAIPSLSFNSPIKSARLSRCNHCQIHLPLLKWKIFRRDLCPAALLYLFFMSRARACRLPV